MIICQAVFATVLMIDGGFCKFSKAPNIRLLKFTCIALIFSRQSQNGIVLCVAKGKLTW